MGYCYYEHLLVTFFYFQGGELAAPHQAIVVTTTFSILPGVSVRTGFWFIFKNVFVKMIFTFVVSMAA